jgi:hypothetical protein
MCLTYGQRRALRKLKRAIRVSDHWLAARLDMLGWLNRDEDMPGIEQSVIPAADQHGSSPGHRDPYACRAGRSLERRRRAHRRRACRR